MCLKSFIICLSKAVAAIQLGFSYSLSILRYLQKRQQRETEAEREVNVRDTWSHFHFSR